MTEVESGHIKIAQGSHRVAREEDKRKPSKNAQMTSSGYVYTIFPAPVAALLQAITDKMGWSGDNARGGGHWIGFLANLSKLIELKWGDQHDARCYLLLPLSKRFHFIPNCGVENIGRIEII